MELMNDKISVLILRPLNIIIHGHKNPIDIWICVVFRPTCRGQSSPVCQTALNVRNAQIHSLHIKSPQFWCILFSFKHSSKSVLPVCLFAASLSLRLFHTILHFWLSEKSLFWLSDIRISLRLQRGWWQIRSMSPYCSVVSLPRSSPSTCSAAARTSGSPSRYECVCVCEGALMRSSTRRWQVRQCF